MLFYNDRTAQLPIDEEFQKLWRSVGVDVMDDAKIDEYLEKQGMNVIQAIICIFNFAKNHKMLLEIGVFKIQHYLFLHLFDASLLPLIWQVLMYVR